MPEIYTSQQSIFFSPPSNPVIAIASIVFSVLLFLPTASSAASVDAESTVISPSAGVESSSRYTASATQSISIPDGIQTYTYSTDWNIPSIETNAIGALFKGQFFLPDHTPASSGITATAEIQTATGETVTYDLPIIGDDRKSAANRYTLASAPLMADTIESYRLHITLHRSPEGETPFLSSVEVISMDSSSDTTPVTKKTVAASTSPTIISREEWEADESYRYTTTENDKGKEVEEEIWPREYVDPKVFIVHHTAGTDGGTDPSATIRAIYYWHAVVLGWGDIGYNYLIDPDGNIYKGRAGTTGVVGAHAYNSVDDINFNRGSIGIALLGCFEETPGACHSKHTTTKKMEASLTELVGWLGNETGINPAASVSFHGRSVYRLVGHRDVDYTYCPGSGVHNDLSGLRSVARDKYNQYDSKEARATSIAATTIDGDEILRKNFDLSEDYTLTVTYQNTSQETWTQEEMNLRFWNKKGNKNSPLYNEETWNTKKGKIQMQEETVAPGDEATFVFNISPPKKDGKKILLAKLYNGDTKVYGSKKKIRMTYSWPYIGELTEATISAYSVIGSSEAVSFTFTNTGEVSWEGTEGISLRVGNNSEKMILAEETVVAPGESVTIETELQMPQIAKHKHIIVDLRRNGKRIDGTRGKYIINVRNQ